jgi:hypothetical protein
MKFIVTSFDDPADDTVKHTALIHHRSHIVSMNPSHTVSGMSSVVRLFKEAVSGGEVI